LPLWTVAYTIEALLQPISCSSDCVSHSRHICVPVVMLDIEPGDLEPVSRLRQQAWLGTHRDSAVTTKQARYGLPVSSVCSFQTVGARAGTSQAFPC